MIKQSKHKAAIKAKDHDKQSDVTVMSVRHVSSKKRMALLGSFVALFLVSAVTAAIVTYYRNGGNNQAVLDTVEPTDDDSVAKITPLEPMPSNNFFSLQLTLGTTTASLIWDLNQEKATASSPFPRNGTYRITSTTDQANANSWEPVNNGKLGTGIELRFDAANGDKLAQWTPVGYDNGTPTENILPTMAQLGQTYYFRLELKEPNGTWKQIENSTLKMSIPYPEVKLVSLPTYDKNVAWTGDSTIDSFDATNPKISIFWYGNGLDETAPGSYLYVSDNPDMQSKQKAVTWNTLTHEAFDPDASTADDSIYALAQEPNKKKYYAVYGPAGQRLSAVTLITTPAP